MAIVHINEKVKKLPKKDLKAWIEKREKLNPVPEMQLELDKLKKLIDVRKPGSKSKGD